MKILIANAINLTTLSNEQLLQTLAEIQNKQVVVWGENALATLILPHLVNKEIKQLASHIHYDDVNTLSEIKVLRTF